MEICQCQGNGEVFSRVLASMTFHLIIGIEKFGIQLILQWEFTMGIYLFGFRLVNCSSQNANSPTELQVSIFLKLYYLYILLELLKVSIDRF